MSRINKFNKNLINFKNNPNFSKIKKIYLENNDFSIASARKLLNMVKYTIKGDVKKQSLSNVEKLNNIIKSYDYKIEPNQSLNEMNKVINKKKISDNEYNQLLKNLNKDHYYTVTIKTKKGTIKHFTMNKKNVKKTMKPIFTSLLKETKTKITNESDQWVIENYDIIDNIEIKDLTNDVFFDDEEKPNRNVKRNVGLFEYYNNHEAIDLKNYQIYKKDDKIDSTNCLIYSLQKYNIDNNIINNIIYKFSEVDNSKNDISVKTFDYIKIKDFEIVAKMINKNINVTSYKLQLGKYIKTNKIYKSNESNDVINLAIYKNHIFINEETKYKRYAVLNYEKLKHKNNWYEYSEKDHKDGKKLTSIELIKLLDENNYFEAIPHNIDINDNILIFKTNDLLKNIDDDQRLFEYKEIKKTNKKIYFADLENINKTNDLNIPFLAGIISEHEKEPTLFFGVGSCIYNLLNYVYKKANPKFKNIIYFHNMKYDFSLMKSDITILNICEKDNQYYSVTIKFKNIIIELRDSYKLFSEKLTKFTSAFRLDSSLTKKESIAYDYYTDKTISENSASIKIYRNKLKDDDEKQNFDEQVKPYILENDKNRFDHIEYYKYYLKYDVLILQQGMKKFNEKINDTFNKSIYDFLTISSFADDYFKSRNVYDDIYEVKSGLKKYLSKAVYGGRVNACKDFKKQIITKDIDDFDGVSLYPSAINRLCLEFGLPKGKCKRLIDLDISNKDYYIVDINITKINKKQQNPFIAVKTDAAIEYVNEIDPNHILTVDKYTLEDYIEFHKIEYKILDGIYYNEGFNNNFKCINDVFNERKKQKELNTPEGEILQNIYKLIMNSAYGKTLLKSSCQKDVIIQNSKLRTYFLNNFNTIKYAKPINNNQTLVSQIEPDYSYNRAQCGISILSYSKRIMNEVMNTANDHKINIYYQDTDSMHIDTDKVKILSEIYDAKYNKTLIGKNLGQFHTDFKHKDKDVIESSIKSIKSIFLGKKAYIDILEGVRASDGKKSYCYHARMKGVNEIALINKSKEYNLNNDYENIFKVYEDLANDKEIEFILNPDEKPSFKFTNQGVQKIKSNEFKRILSFKSGELTTTEKTN